MKANTHPRLRKWLGTVDTFNKWFIGKQGGIELLDSELVKC